MSERVKLDILEVKETQKVGDKGAQKLSFQASDKANGREYQYFTFSSRLFPLIQKGKTLEVDVDVSTHEYGGNQYIDRKVVQVYVDGQPFSRPSFGQPSQAFQKDTASIQTQTAFKGVIELMVAGLVKADDALGVLALNWAREQLSGAKGLSATPQLGDGAVAHSPKVETPFGQEGSEKVAAPQMPSVSPAVDASEPMITPRQKKAIQDIVLDMGGLETSRALWDSVGRVCKLGDLTEAEADKLLAHLKAKVNN